MTFSDQKRARAIFFLLVILLSLTWLSRGAITIIVRSWRQEEYSHGFFIPLIMLVLLINKMESAPIVPKTSWAAFAILLLCLMLQALCQIAGLRGVLPEIYVISLISAVATCWGLRALLLWAGPLGFMLFAAPLPNYLYYSISVSMQSLSTSLGTFVLELVNVPVFRDGNIIDLGGYKLQVAEACSGLRYLFPLLSLSYLFAYIYKAPFAKRVIVFFSAIPIAIFMNGLRIAFIGITVDKWGAGMAEGPLHEMEGLVVFLGCTFCLLCEIRLLELTGVKSALHFDAVKLPRLKNFIFPALGTPVHAAVITVLLAIAADSAMNFTSSLVKEVPLRQSFEYFPLQFGSWIAHRGAIDAVSLTKLGTQDYLLADYKKPETPPVNLYMLYYPFQDGSSNEAIHSPMVCIPGGGWGIDMASTRNLMLGGNLPLSVNRVAISKNNVRQIVYYWFIQGGHTTLSPYASRLYMLDTALRLGHTNGAMVRVVTEINGKESPDDADKRLQDFLNESFETVNDFMFPTDTTLLNTRIDAGK